MICQIARDVPAGWAGTLHPDPARVLPPGVTSVVPNLHEYDLIIIRISGGKDSQAAMRETWRHVVAQGVDPSCVLVEYDELNGDRADEKATWPGTAEIGAHLVAKYGDRPGSRELARRQAAHYQTTRRRRQSGTCKRPCSPDDLPGPGRPVL